jgi:hypothetical protein
MRIIILIKWTGIVRVKLDYNSIMVSSLRNCQVKTDVVELTITARQLREFALPAQLTGLSFVPLGLGTVPVASWYGAIFAK